MSTLVAITIGFIAIIAVGTTAAWIYDVLEARWADLAARTRIGESASGLVRWLRRPRRDDHRRRAPVYHHAVGARRVVMHAAGRDRTLRS